MNYKHGYAKKSGINPEYETWQKIKGRCYNPKNKDYPRYGARGIRMCAPWFYDFELFLNDVGQRPSELHSIDRINNNENYEPGNCKWSTKQEQANNRRSNHWIKFNGKIDTVTAWSKYFGIGHSVLIRYIQRNGEDKAFEHYNKK